MFYKVLIIKIQKMCKYKVKTSIRNKSKKEETEREGQNWAKFKILFRIKTRQYGKI